MKNNNLPHTRIIFIFSLLYDDNYKMLKPYTVRVLLVRCKFKYRESSINNFK